MRRRGWIRSGRGGDNPERLMALEKAVERLREEAEGGTVVVEGARDLAALERLGIGGRHVAVHHGRPLPEVLENLAAASPPVILLLDWDRTGGHLFGRLHEGLRSRVRVDAECRRRLATATHCRSLEEVPAELAALREAA